MTTPTYCASCGHELGIGRFCTNCGKPVPGRHPEAAPRADVSPAMRPTLPPPPPPAGPAPPAARYPLFADDPATTAAAETAPPAPSAGPPGTGPDRRVPRWLPWVVAVVAVALVAGVVGTVLVSSGDDGRADEGTRQDQTTDPGEEGGGPGRPDSEGTDGPVDAPAPGDVADLTDRVEARVPAVAPPSRDRDNRPVDFETDNLFDGRPRTSWRMPGDGTGETLTFDLGEEVVLTEVGLINGYAKVDGPDNWYRGNRRIREVQWEFDDGTRISQELLDRQTMQSLRVDPVSTTTIRLHLLTVTPPGAGPNGRDFTAISEVRIRGAA